MDVVYQAANRQNHIDQGQSLNIIVHPDMPIKEINKIHITAWKLGVKSLYYQHSMNAAQSSNKKRMYQLRRIIPQVIYTMKAPIQKYEGFLLPKIQFVKLKF